MSIEDLNCYEQGLEHDFSEPKDMGGGVWRVKCRRCGLEEVEYLFVRYWPHRTITVQGKTYRALRAWGNISLCSECRKPIFDVPLILWNSVDPTAALTFHFDCAREIGTLDHLVRSGR